MGKLNLDNLVAIQNALSKIYLTLLLNNNLATYASNLLDIFLLNRWTQFAWVSMKRCQQSVSLFVQIKIHTIATVPLSTTLLSRFSKLLRLRFTCECVYFTLLLFVLSLHTAVLPLCALLSSLAIEPPTRESLYCTFFYKWVYMCYSFYYQIVSLICKYLLMASYYSFFNN